MRFKPHPYQQVAFDHIIQNPFCGVFMDMGLGKTVVTGTAINHLIYSECEYEKALVIAPKRVVQSVWKQEMAKWDHLKHLKVSIVWGQNQAERIKALKQKADIYLINREMVVWLVKLFQSKWPFPLTIIDEASSFKAHDSQRFKHLKMVRPKIRRLIELTGTPAPNSLMDLWAPLYLLDEGQRLEKNISAFREHYFVQRNPNERFSGYRVRKGADEAIYNKIGDICISMKARDYLDLPPLIENDIYLNLSSQMYDRYEKFEEECVMEIFKDNGDGVEVTALNAAALSIKLRQFSNGAIYHEMPNGFRDWTELHSEKLDALGELMEELWGENVIVTYSFQHDLARILKKFPYARVLKSDKDVQDWNLGKIRMLVIHPKSAGHGLNLQDGGNNIIMFSLDWSAELYRQVIARLMRQGQKKPVYLRRLIMGDTVDMRIVESLNDKMSGEDALMHAVRAIVNDVRARLSANRGTL